MSATYIVKIPKVKLFGYHGCYNKEKKEGQQFEISIKVVFLRNNFPLTNFYMFVLKKYKFRSEHRKKFNINESPIFTDKVNLKAKWTYSNENKIEGYDLGIREGNQIMVDQMEKLYEILSQQSIKLSLAVYPWPHQLENDVINSIHVEIWQEFCKIWAIARQLKS